MSAILENKRVAILATDGFEQVELEEPMHALKQAGATVSIVSPKAGTVQGMNHLEKGDNFNVDLTLDSVNASDFDAWYCRAGWPTPILCAPPGMQ